MYGRVKMALAVAGALAIAAAPGAAQRGPGGNGPMGRGPAGPGLRGPGIEAILSQREALDLTDEQVESLEALQQQMRASVEPIRDDAREAGDRAREELRERLDARRETLRAFRERMEAVHQQGKDGAQDILTEEQLRTLEGMRAERARGAGRVGALRRGGPWGARGGPAASGRGGARGGVRGLAPGRGVRGPAFRDAWPRGGVRPYAGFRRGRLPQRGGPGG